MQINLFRFILPTSSYSVYIKKKKYKNQFCIQNLDNLSTRKKLLDDQIYLNIDHTILRDLQVYLFQKFSIKSVMTQLIIFL